MGRNVFSFESYLQCQNTNMPLSNDSYSTLLLQKVKRKQEKDIHKKFKAFANKQKIDLLDTFLVSRKVAIKTFYVIIHETLFTFNNGVFTIKLYREFSL